MEERVSPSTVRPRKFLAVHVCKAHDNDITVCLFSTPRLNPQVKNVVEVRSSGRFTVLRQTVRKRLQAKLNEVKTELRRRMHHPIPEVGQWLRSVVDGHNRYYGVPMNDAALHLFRLQVGRLWHRTLSRRSQNGHVPWDRMHRLIVHWLHPVRIYHPYPLRRMGVVT